MRTLSMLMTVTVLTGVSFVMPETPASAYTSAQRAAIRSMPLEQRPNRPGHVYGNTVRRINKIAR